MLNYLEYKSDSRVVTKNEFDYILPDQWYDYELEEWLKCKLNPLHFILNYIYVMKEDQGSRFLLRDIIYQPQRELIENILQKRKVIVLKTRQTGITTIISQLCCYLLLFNRQYKIGILSHNAEHQSGFIDRKIKTMMNYIPPIFLKPVSTNNKQQIIFRDGNEEESWIMQEQPGPNSFPFTGETINFMFLDEQQKINFIERHYQSLTPTMSTMLNQSEEQQKKRPTGICIVSTPYGTDGIGGWFHKQYSKNKDTQIPDYFPMFIHWKDCGLTEDWYNKQKSIYNNDEKLIRQELDQEFLGSGDTYYNLNILLSLKYKSSKQKQIFWKRKQGNEFEEIEDYRYMSMWEEVLEDHQYIIGIDPQDSEGDSQDYTQIEVIDQYTQCQVQEWKGKINTVDMQYFLLAIQKVFNNQIIGIEKNKGFHIIDKLLYELNYDNVFYYKENIQGIQVTGVNRKQIIDLISNLLPEYNEVDYDFLRSKDLIEEMFQFQYRTVSRVEQKKGTHDDLIFQFCYALYVREHTVSDIYKTNKLNMLEKAEITSIEKQYDLINLVKQIRGG